DLDKWKALPSSIQNRLIELLKHHRLGIVCFMGECGLGLRVYKDFPDGKLIIGGDEVTCTKDKTKKGELSVNLSGWWMRCPAYLYTDEEKEVKNYLVMDDFGRKYFRRWESLHDEDEDSDEEDVDDDPQPGNRRANWTTVRSLALRLTEADAQEIVAEVSNSL